MSAITVTKKFRDNFEMFVSHRISSQQWTAQEAADFKNLVRIDLMPGPDQLRNECEYLDSKGVAHPAVIDDENERYRVWDAFFADECEIIHQQQTGYVGSAAGINQRIRADMAIKGAA